VLHLLAGFEVVATDRRRRRVPDAVAAAERGEARVREVDAVAREQLLVDAHKVALAVGVQLGDLVAHRGGLLGARQWWRWCATVGDDALHGGA
jgi:hypothetical protein